MWSPMRVYGTPGLRSNIAKQYLSRVRMGILVIIRTIHMYIYIYMHKGVQSSVSKFTPTCTPEDQIVKPRTTSTE